jgi:hypothetical protein
MSLQQELLSNEELAQICAPLRQRGAQRRFLQSRGVNFWTSADGTPVVRRSDWYACLTGSVPVGPSIAPPTEEPDHDAFIASFAGRRSKGKRQTS